MSAIDPRDISRPGDPVKPALAAAAAAALANRVMRSEDVMLAKRPGGTTISAAQGPTGWSHPWRCWLAGNGAARLAPGLVNGAEPEVGSAPLSDGREIKIAQKAANAEGVSWLVVDAWEEMSADGKMRLTRCEIEHAGSLAAPAKGPDGNAGRQPLARIEWSGGRPVVFQVAHHNLNYAFIPGDGDRRQPAHRFWAV